MTNRLNSTYQNVFRVRITRGRTRKNAGRQPITKQARRKMIRKACAASKAARLQKKT